MDVDFKTGRGKEEVHFDVKLQTFFFLTSDLGRWRAGVAVDARGVLIIATFDTPVFPIFVFGIYRRISRVLVLRPLGRRLSPACAEREATGQPPSRPDPAGELP